MDKPLPRGTRVDPKHPCAQLFCSYGLSVGRVRPYGCKEPTTLKGVGAKAGA